MIIVLEQYLQNMANNPNNANLQDTMKSKDALKSEVTQKLNVVLKDRAIDDFLKKSASEIYQPIVEIFKKKLNEKVDEFLNNLDKNVEANKFFETCEALDEKKELKLREKINPYIKGLQEKEEKSQERALTASFGPSSQMMTSSQGETGESVPSSSYGQFGPSSSSGQGGETGETGESKINNWS